MENKKTIIGIILVVILIIILITISYTSSKFNKEQLNLLTNETNELLQKNILDEDIETNIKTEKSYATVEKTMKEYLINLKNIYSNINQLYTQINPNDIFSTQNIEDKNFDDIDNIIEDYKNKAKECLSDYQELVKEENIKKSINEKNIAKRQEYFVDLYNTAMLSDVMKEKYESIGKRIEKKRDNIYDKLNSLEKVKKYLEENEKYWTIKDNKIQFNNINKMTEYYSLLNSEETD
ncbi:MAG: hypothetical protein HFJ55_05225 [Clostridia bacterium]|nr:hypothetical protein [Clostridia bacterium]